MYNTVECVQTRILHVESKVVHEIINMLKNIYEKYDPITVTQDKVHETLVMEIYFSYQGKVIIKMDDHISKILE